LLAISFQLSNWPYFLYKEPKCPQPNLAIHAASRHGLTQRADAIDFDHDDLTLPQETGRRNVSFGSKLRNTQDEQMSSGLPLKADIAQ
jgi:hypothetical protein